MNSIQFLKGGGEMGALTRDYDWSNSAIKSPEYWPGSLRTTVALVLSSRFPMFLWWGDELIQFYNDAYRPSLGNKGKHPIALGQRGEDCWPEIWSTIKPLIDQVMSGGEAVWRENQLIPIYRNGQMEDVYWTFSYGAVLNDSDQINGVLVVCQETTKSVLNHRKTQESETKFRSIIEQAPMAISLLKGKEMIIEVCNDTIFKVWGKDKSIIGMPLHVALPELKGQIFMDLLEGVYNTGEAFFGTGTSATLERNGKLDEIYFDFSYTPLHNSEGIIYGIMILAIEVTEQIMDKKKVEESEIRFRNLSEQLDKEVQQRTEQLQVSIKDLQRSNESLQQFAYVASHDLQEPLRKIQSFGDLLKVRYADNLGNGAEYLNRMQSAANRMSLLIDDLMAFASISIHQHGFVRLSINDIVDEVLQELELVILQTGAVVNVGSLPVINGDASQMRQLFQNLLSNALKFHRNDINPVIEISSQIQNAGSLSPSVKPASIATAYHRIDVSDNGIGFDNQYTNRIFQVFQRLHGKNEFAGTGIGLAICEKVAVNHGGAITADSHPGKGSIFSIYIPL